jgi:SHS2 domain-containing protein
VREPITARGATLREAFSEAMLGLFAQVVDPAAVQARDVREVRAHGDSLEDLLARWIAECLYVHEVEGFAFRAVDVARFEVEPRAGGEPMRLHAFLHGEELNPARHQVPRPIRLPAPADISIRPDTDGYEIRVMGETSL